MKSIVISLATALTISATSAYAGEWFGFVVVCTAGKSGDDFCSVRYERKWRFKERKTCLDWVAVQIFKEGLGMRRLADVTQNQLIKGDCYPVWVAS
tara:strand:+ start:271 stop:558 length:288 start_codon:yes stop_codon:yes gene_type:complete